MASNSNGQEHVAGQGHAIITGGSSGIGLCMAAQLGAQGMAVSLLARDRDRLEEARRTLLSGGIPDDKVQTFSVDVMDAEACRQAVAACVERFGAPDWTVASAGSVEPGTFEELPVEAHRRQMESNYFGTVHFLHAAVPYMRDAGGGHLVIISSAAAIIGVYGYAAFGPSKFALRGLAETLCIELRPAGINVTIAYPPDTDTPSLKEELQVRDGITNDIAAFAGLWKPEAVARHIIRTAKAGRFTSTPGLSNAIPFILDSTISRVFRAYQHRVVKRNLRKQKKTGE